MENDSPSGGEKFRWMDWLVMSTSVWRSPNAAVTAMTLVSTSNDPAT